MIRRSLLFTALATAGLLGSLAVSAAGPLNATRRGRAPAARSPSRAANTHERFERATLERDEEGTAVKGP